MSSVFGGHQNKWEDGLCLTDMSFLDLVESCNTLQGHEILCDDPIEEGEGEGKDGQQQQQQHLCRLCDRCLPGHQREIGNTCSKCPDAESNRGLLSVGAILVLFAVAVLVYLQIKNNGQGELSDGVKKILLNWLQVSSMASSFPLKWPSAIAGLFVVQSVLSSVGQHLVDPDCELSLFSPAEAFYRKNILYASFPILAFFLPWTFWFIMSKCRYCSGDRGWRGRQNVFGEEEDESDKDENEDKESDDDSASGESSENDENNGSNGSEGGEERVKDQEEEEEESEEEKEKENFQQQRQGHSFVRCESLLVVPNHNAANVQPAVVQTSWRQLLVDRRFGGALLQWSSSLVFFSSCHSTNVIVHLWTSWRLSVLFTSKSSKN